MVRFKKTFLTLLSVMAVIFITVGFCTFGAFAETSRIYVSSESDGYVCSDDAFTVKADSVISVTFDLPYVLNIGSGYVGFGIMHEDYVSEKFADSDNSSYGYAVLFNDAVSFIGLDGANGSSADFNKERLFKSGYTYNVSFDNQTGYFAVERKNSGSNLYSIIYEVENVKILEEGDYRVAIMFSEGTEFVLDELKFAIDDSKFGINGGVILSDGMTYTEGGAYNVFDVAEVASYTNETAINGAKATNGQIVISLETSLFENNGGEIGFAIGTEKNGAVAFGGENGVFFSLGDFQGVKKYKNGSFGSFSLIDEYIDAGSIFSSGRAVKAIFDLNNGTFTLLTRFATGAAYLKVFSCDGITYPTDGIYIGLQFRGDVYLKTSDIAFYVPNNIEDYMTCAEAHKFSYAKNYAQDGSSLSVSETDGRTEVVFTQTGESIPSTFLLTDEPFTVSAGESVVMLLENVKWTMTSPTYTAKTSFTFANGKVCANTSNMYMYAYNRSVSMFYNLNRSEYYTTTPELLNVDLGQSVTFYDLFEEGNSIMAVFSPEYQKYSLYMKSASEPDFTLWQTFNVPSGYEIDNEIYVGLELCGGMILEYDELKAYTAKNEDIGVAPAVKTEYSDSANGETVSGGFKIAATSDVYIKFDGVSADSVDAVAIEYSLEKISYSQGQYNLGFLITDNPIFPLDPPLFDWDKGEYVTDDDGAFTEGSKSQFYSFIPSNGLTDTTNDKMRDFLFHSGYTVRVVFDLKNKTVTVQYKTQTGYCWNDVATYEGVPEFVSGDTVYMALRIENTSEIALSKLGSYSLKGGCEVYNYYIEGGSSIDIGDSAMYTVKAETENSSAGTAFIDDGLSAVYTVGGANVTLYAEPNDEYVFSGWYLDGTLVSEEAEFEIEVFGNANYKAVFSPASCVVVTNGLGTVKSTVTGYYADGKYIGVNPEKVQGYKFTGWTIIFKEVSEEEDIVVAKYYLGLDGEEGENMLSGKNLSVWKTLVNGIASGDECVISASKSGSNELTFGMFTVIDRKGYENGALIINVPSVKSDYDENGNVITERKVEIQANYVKSAITSSGTLEKDYSDAYVKNFNEVTKWFWIIASITALLVAALVVIKIYINKKEQK